MCHFGFFTLEHFLRLEDLLFVGHVFGFELVDFGYRLKHLFARVFQVTLFF